MNLSTAKHPESDGQSEREIQTLITALRSYTNAMGDDWDEYLPALELAFNSKVQASREHRLSRSCTARRPACQLTVRSTTLDRLRCRLWDSARNV